MLSYQNIKRGSIDICNICSERKKLSRDHVPPKTCYNSGKFEYTSIFPEIEKNKENVQKVQNGIKFRTICEQCNNERLGLFDKSLKDFYDYIFSIVISDIVVPEKVYYTGDINKICRSIFGHVLSMRKDYIKNAYVKKLERFQIKT